MDLMFADAHTHTNPVSGLGMKRIAEKFREVGGWFMAIVSLPPSHYGYPSTIEGYEKSYEILLRECNEARNHGLRIACIAGIHPADIEKSVSRAQPDKYRKIIETYLGVLRILEHMLKQGELQGLGEFGRPHYKAIPEAFALNDIVLIKALELAKDYSIPIHIHCEQSGAIAVEYLKAITSIVGIDKRLVIVHHVDTKTLLSALEEGFNCTVLGRYELLKSIAMRRVAPMYMIESDYIDDPRRPGVAAYPWEIVENQLRLLKDGIVDTRYLRKLNVDNVERVYGSLIT